MVERPVTYNSLTFNDRSKATLRTAPYYWINLTSVDGLYGDEIQYESHPKPCGTGERSSAPKRAGKQLTLSGQIWAPNLAALRNGEEALQQAFWDMGGSSGKHLIWCPWNLYVADNTATVYFVVKQNQPLVILDQFTTNQMMQTWTVGLRADDPRLYKTADNTLYYSWQM